ncbi:MAG: DUF4231 domain-containing protein [bacterium]
MNDRFEDLQRRIEPQRQWHSDKAKWNKRLFYCVEVATLLRGVVIPVVNLWAGAKPQWSGVLSNILGGVVVVATADGKRFRFQENCCRR